jgi:hypothetical protein
VHETEICAQECNSCCAAMLTHRGNIGCKFCIACTQSLHIIRGKDWGRYAITCTLAFASFRPVTFGIQAQYFSSELFYWTSATCSVKSRKIAGSVTDEVIGIFNWPNPSSHTVALGFTQPLTEMNTRHLRGKEQLVYKADDLTAITEPAV